MDLHAEGGRKGQPMPDRLGARSSAGPAQACHSASGAPAPAEGQKGAKGPLPRPKWLDMLGSPLAGQQGNSNASSKPTAPHAPPPAGPPSPTALLLYRLPTKLDIRSSANLEREQVEAAAGLVMMCSDSPSSAGLTAEVPSTTLPCARTPRGTAHTTAPLHTFPTAVTASHRTPPTMPALPGATLAAAPNTTCQTPCRPTLLPDTQPATDVAPPRGTTVRGGSPTEVAGGIIKRKAKSGPQSRTSPYIGVSQIRPSGSSGKSKKAGRWEAHIWDSSENNGKGKQLHLGSFNTAIQAAKVYDRVALVLRGKTTELNFAAATYDDDPHIEGLRNLPKRDLVLAVRKIQDEPEEQAVIAAEAKAQQERADRLKAKAHNAAIRRARLAGGLHAHADGSDSDATVNCNADSMQLDESTPTAREQLTERRSKPGHAAAADKQQPAASRQGATTTRLVRRSHHTGPAARRATRNMQAAATDQDDIASKVAAVGDASPVQTAPEQAATDGVSVKADAAALSAQCVASILGCESELPQLRDGSKGSTSSAKRASTAPARSNNKRVRLRVRQSSMPADDVCLPTSLGTCQVSPAAAANAWNKKGAHSVDNALDKLEHPGMKVQPHNHCEAGMTARPPQQTKQQKPALTAREPAVTAKTAHNNIHETQLFTPEARSRWGKGHARVALQQFAAGDSSQCAAAEQSLQQAAASAQLSNGAVSKAVNACDAASMPLAQQQLSAAANGTPAHVVIVFAADTMTPMQLDTPVPAANAAVQQQQQQQQQQLTIPTSNRPAGSAQAHTHTGSGAVDECSTPLAARASRRDTDSFMHQPSVLVGSPSWFPNLDTPSRVMLPSLTPDGQPSAQQHRSILGTPTMSCWLDDELQVCSQPGLSSPVAPLRLRHVYTTTNLADNAGLSHNFMLRDQQQERRASIGLGSTAGLLSQPRLRVSCKQEPEDNGWHASNDNTSGLMMMSPPADPAGRLRSAFADGHMSAVPVMALPYNPPGATLLDQQPFLLPAPTSPGFQMEGSNAAAYPPWDHAGPAVPAQQYNSAGSYVVHTGTVSVAGTGIALSHR